MTDLGNGLFAIKVDKDTYGYENWNDELFYKMSEWSSGSKPIGFETVFEYGAKEITAHITYVDGHRPEGEGFVTVFPSIYD